MEVQERELNEAVRLMEMAGGLGGELRRGIERKAVDTFWRSVRISAHDDQGRVSGVVGLALPDLGGSFGRQANR